MPGNPAAHDFAEQLQLALRARQAGRLDEAAAICSRVLAAEPSQPDAWNMLGMLHFQARRHSAAIDHIRHAIELRPHEPVFHVNLGELCRAGGRLLEAEASYRRALELQPQLFIAHNGLGIVLCLLGQPAEALASFDRALEWKPDYGDAHRNRGLALKELGQLDEAIRAFSEALRWQSDDVAAYQQLGLAYRQQGQAAAALDCFQEALCRAPDSAEIHNDQGRAWVLAGAMDRAIDAFRRATELNPRMAEAHNNLGIVYKTQGHFDQAIACYRQALAIRPDYIEALSNLGNARFRQGQFAEAADAYRQAIALGPAIAEGYTSLGASLVMLGAADEAIAAFENSLKLQPSSLRTVNNLGTALKDQGRLAEALERMRQAVELDPSSAAAHCSLLYCLNYTPIEPAELLAEHRAWEVRHLRDVVRWPLPPNPRDPDRRLRIGYVSPDFRRHPVAAFIEPVLRGHDRRHFETFVYSECVNTDETTARLRGLVGHWRDTFGWSDAELAARIRADEIDIVVELAGHTSLNRLRALAVRPAPIQVSYLGYPATTGLTSIDYRLTDSIADPPGESSHYSEQLCRLSPGFCCFAPAEDAPPVSVLPGLNRREITLGALHHLAKLNADVLDLWATLLHALPDARLLLYRDSLRGTAAERLARELTERGLGPERYELRHTLPPGASHLTLYQEIDVALDVFPWSGHTTTCEALWMGVPVVTWRGHRFAGRMAASVLTLAGLTDWIADDREQYVSIVLRSVADRVKLAALRGDLRARLLRSPLCDGAGFTRSLEAAYRGMWQRYCAGSPADSAAG